jgi:hypothetical protein
MKGYMDLFQFFKDILDITKCLGIYWTQPLIYKDMWSHAFPLKHILEIKSDGSTCFIFTWIFI